MEPEALEARLRALDAGRAAELEMRFSDAGLVLGAGTVLARAGASARDISIDVTEGRLIALLAAAHRRPPAASDLTHLRKAVESWREGEDGLAEMHLALSRLAQLERPISDARRLFLADGLLGAGFEADTLLRALDLEAPLDGGGVSKYSADQPRVPAGSGRTSGEWTSGLGSTSTSPDATSQRASHASRRAAPAQHRPSSTPQTRAPAPPSPSGTGAAMAPAVANAGPAVRQFSIDLPSTIIGAASPPNLGPFGQAVGALADTIEVADSIAKWRELGPRGEALVIEAGGGEGMAALGYARPHSNGAGT